jgi:hypothetical protein
VFGLIYSLIFSGLLRQPVNVHPAVSKISVKTLKSRLLLNVAIIHKELSWSQFNETVFEINSLF